MLPPCGQTQILNTSEQSDHVQKFKQIKKKKKITKLIKEEKEKKNKQTWGGEKLQSQASMVSAPVLRTCCSPQSWGSSWTCGDTSEKLWPPKHVCQGNVGPGWGRPAPDSRRATGLPRAAEPSPPGSSAQTIHRQLSQIWYIPFITLHLFVSKYHRYIYP